MTTSNNFTEPDDVTKGNTSSIYNVTDVTKVNDLNDSTLGGPSTTVETTIKQTTTSSSILSTLRDIITTEDSVTTSIELELTTAPPEAKGLTDMEKWFLVTACLIAACLVLMVINALLHYKETVMSELRKRHIGRDKRVRRDGMAGDGDDRKEYQTHVFYHPFTSRGMDDLAHTNHL